MKTAPISNLIKFTVLDAVQAARKDLRDLSQCGIPAVESKAAALVPVADWANDLILKDEHDATLAARIGSIIVDLEEMAPSVAQSHGVRSVAQRLRVASLLLFSARREADLAARLRNILPDIYGIHGMASEDAAGRAEDIIINANRIARLARA